MEPWEDLDALYDSVIAAELARPGTRALPAGFPRPKLPPPLRESIRAAATLADVAPLVDFYCDCMPRMLVDQLLRDETPAGKLLWMPIDMERAPRLRTAARGLGRVLAAASSRVVLPPDLLASPCSAAALAARTLLLRAPRRRLGAAPGRGHRRPGGRRPGRAD